MTCSMGVGVGGEDGEVVGIREEFARVSGDGKGGHVGVEEDSVDDGSL